MFCSLPPIFRESADSNEKNIERIRATRATYLNKFSLRDLSFEFAKDSWIEYLEQKVAYFGIPLLMAGVELLKQRLSPVSLVANKGQVSLAAAADTRIHDDYNEDWNSKGAEALDLKALRLFGAKGLLGGFRDSCRALECKISRPVAETFHLAIEMVNQYISIDAGLSTDLIL